MFKEGNHPIEEISKSSSGQESHRHEEVFFDEKEEIPAEIEAAEGNALDDELKDYAQKTAEDISKIYNGIFLDNPIDKNELERIIFKNGQEIAANIYKTVEIKYNKGEANKSIKTALKKEWEPKIKNIEKFKEIALKINNLCEDISKKDSEIRQKDYLEYLQWERNNIKAGIENSPYKDSELEEFDEMYGFFEDGEADTTEEYHLSEENFLRLSDSQIESEIRGIENMYKRETGSKKLADDHFSQEIIKNIEKNRRYDEERFKPIADKLKLLLNYRINLRKKAEEIIFEKESIALPENFEEKITKDIKNYSPEITENGKKKYYLLTGVSSRLPKEKEIHKKPLDALAYMFWAQNQGIKNLELTVCDAMQESNYQKLYDVTKEEAREKAVENGHQDKKWYNAVKDVFNLEKIEMGNYQELEQDTKMSENLKSLDKLEQENPLFEKAFEAMVEKSVAKKAKDKIGLSDYGKTEIALILSRNDIKISHKKELRYDILARIIPIYEELKNHLEEIPELKMAENKEQALVDLSLYLGYQHNFPFSYGLSLDILELNQRLDSNQKLLRSVSKGNKEFLKKEKSDLIVSAQELKKELEQTAKKFKEEKEKIDDIEQTFKSLGLSENPKQNALRWRNAGNLIAKQEWFNQLDLPEFYYPKQVTGLSFEMRDGKGHEHMNFREFYSTFKGDDEEELAVEANQLIASAGPLAAAKLLVLSKEKQLHYFEKVLKPLLINFYIANSKSKEEAAMKFTDDIKGVRDIPELVNLIQRKIILPIERELK